MGNSPSNREEHEEPSIIKLPNNHQAATTDYPNIHFLRDPPTKDMAANYKWPQTQAYHIPVFEYNANTWQSTYTPNQTPSASHTIFTVLTYNIWFDAFMSQQRYQEIFNICQQHAPDVICFQEATKNFLQLLELQSWVRDGYILSDISSNMRSFSTWYGVVILVKKSVKLDKMYLNTLTSSMGRNCVTAQIVVNNQVVKIGTVHLESLANKHLREHQLKEICKNVLTTETAMLMGDFNFDDERNWSDSDHSPVENVIFTQDPDVSKFVDIWTLFNGPSTGKTFDSTVNKMLTHYEVMRYDRIISKSLKQNWTPKSIAMIGNTEFLRVKDTPIFPSDHFGLVATFSLLA